MKEQGTFLEVLWLAMTSPWNAADFVLMLVLWAFFAVGLYLALLILGGVFRVLRWVARGIARLFMRIVRDVEEALQ